MIFSLDLPNFPDWAIPMAKIIPVIKILNGYDLNSDEFFISPDFSYAWKKVDNNHYNLEIDISVSASFGGDSIPVYLDLDVVIVNERQYFTTQTEGY